MLSSSLRMDDAAPRRHPVDRTGLDQLLRAQAVAVHHRALEQVRHGGQADVRMGPHIVVDTGYFGHRPKMVEEDKRANAALPRRGQQPAHCETAAEVLVVAVQLLHDSYGRLANVSCAQPFRRRACRTACRFPGRRAASHRARNRKAIATWRRRTTQGS